MNQEPGPDASQYTVVWLCALPKSELTAARLMLDKEYPPLPVALHDSNLYYYGAIDGHNVVIVCMPPGRPGSVSASYMVHPLQQAFPNLKVHLFVGIGGGVPCQFSDSEPTNDIHLGDVVVGWPEVTGNPAVVQYDLKIQEDGKFTLLGTLDMPHRHLLTALGAILSNREIGHPHTSFQRHLSRLNLYPKFSHPGHELDRLFSQDCLHVDGESDCSRCDAGQLVKREPRRTQDPIFHQGTILSGNSVMKDARQRDQLSKQFHNALCFEMETAGVINEIHCLVIRGISDYSDSHKADDKISQGSWQRYAAATAAAFAREFLCVLPCKTVESMDSIQLANKHIYPQHGVQSPAQFGVGGVEKGYGHVNQVSFQSLGDLKSRCVTSTNVAIG